MEKISRWLSYFGNAHKINFTIEHNFKEQPSLEILIKNQNGQIITDIYYKHTDTQLYRHLKRHHPKNCIKSIPYILARRICAVVIHKNLQQTQLKDLGVTLHYRGYFITLINKRFE